MVGVRPFCLSCEEEAGGFDKREVVEGEERRVDVWIQRLDFRVLSLALRDSISVSSGDGVDDGGVGDDMVRLW